MTDAERPAESASAATAAPGDLGAAFDDGPAFVPYLVAGDPSDEASKAYAEALDRGGADVIELGLPFSEPMAEGPTIQAAIGRALGAGMTPDRYFELVESLDVDAALVCMTYYNLVYQYGAHEGPRSSEASGDAASKGPAPFVERAAEAGISGLVVPDLPAEEADDLRAACDEHGLDLIFIVAPTTDGERLERIRERVSGYVYVQARLGTTGARTDVSDRTDASLARIADWAVPKAVGFGISSGDHAERIVAAGADGVIVGSALIDVIAAGIEADGGASTGEEPDVAIEETADRLESLARELVAGARRGAGERESAVGQGRPEPEGN